MTTSIYSADEFWAAFTRDFIGAGARILLHSPFLGARRIKILSKEIELATRRGVVVCAFVQEPQHWGTDSKFLNPECTYEIAEMRLLIEMLQSLGVHVNLRKKIHAKLAVIDEAILWEGSLNILSHVNTQEHMRRSTQKRDISDVFNKHGPFNCSNCAANGLKVGVADGESWSWSLFGKVVQRHRVRLGLTQRELARRCGISHSRISQIEAGKNNFTASTLTQLADHLGMEPLLVPKLLVHSVANLLHQASTSSRPDFQLLSGDAGPTGTHQIPSRTRR
jgi:transcriptional regulator with XRE-family HTH domain